MLGFCSAKLYAQETWEEVTSPSETDNLNAVAADGSFFVAVGKGGRIFTSIDGGATFATSTTATEKELKAVGVYDDGANGIAIAVGNKNGSDGEIWVGNITTLHGGGSLTQKTITGLNENIEAVSYDGSSGNAVAGGKDGAIVYSTNDGTNWTSDIQGDDFKDVVVA